MSSAVSRYPSGNDLTPFRNEISQDPGAFVIDFEGLIGTEATHFSLDIDSSSPVPVRGIPHSVNLPLASTGLCARKFPKVFNRIGYNFHLCSGLAFRGFPSPLFHFPLN